MQADWGLAFAFQGRKTTFHAAKAPFSPVHAKIRVYLPPVQRAGWEGLPHLFGGKRGFSMKMHMNLKRLLPVLLSLVLLIGLLPLAAVTASAAGNSFAYAYDCQRSGNPWPAAGSTFTATDITTPLGSSTSTGNWTLTEVGYYTPTMGGGTYLGGVVRNIASQYHLDPAQVMVYDLKKDGTHIAYGPIFARTSNAGELAVFLGDNWNNSGATYLLSDNPLGSSVTVTIGVDVSTNAPHAHSWSATTSGIGTKEATATITCIGTNTDPSCGETQTITLKASDVTLPGNVFNAQIEKTSGSTNSRAAQNAVNLLTVSQTPGYQYSPNGSGFTPIQDPNGFAPKQGIYQASIVVMNGNVQVANLAVKYTVSDPKVTAATGDERPIELMAAGLVVFSMMAAAAFVFDSKRKSVR